MIVAFTPSRLHAWAARWPCSTLRPGAAVFDTRTGDLVDLHGALSRADIDGHEFDAFVDDYQSKELRAVRGLRG